VRHFSGGASHIAKEVALGELMYGIAIDTYAGDIILNSAVAGLKMAHILKITVAFEFSVLTLTVPGLRLRKIQNPSCF
jgi:hypothetical protein